MSLRAWLGEVQDRPTLDLGQLEPRIPAVQKAKRQQDWGEISRVLTRVRSPDLRDLIIRNIGEEGEDPAILDPWIASHPEQSLAYHARGYALVGWAAEARGSGTADTVTEEGGRLFVQRLLRAEEDLIQAAKLDPESAGPWVGLIQCATGLNADLEERLARFKMGRDRQIDHYALYDRALNALTAKWGGRHGAMFGLARYASQVAPMGHPLHALIARAHIERWVYFHMQGATAAARQYFDRIDVMNEIIDGARKSMLASGYRYELWHVSAASSLSYALWIGKERRAATEIFDLMGRGMDNIPWCYSGPAESTFLRARQECKRASTL